MNRTFGNIYRGNRWVWAWHRREQGERVLRCGGKLFGVYFVFTLQLKRAP